MRKKKKEFAPGSRLLVVSFVGEPFGGNKTDGDLFLSNRLKMFDFIEK